MANRRQVAFRFDERLIQRVDDYAKYLERQYPGKTVSRADAVRVLLNRSLDDVLLHEPVYEEDDDS